MTEKKKRGQPRKEETKVLSFRVPKKYAEKLKELIQETIDKELK